MLLYFAQKWASETKIFRINEIDIFKNNFEFNLDPDPNLNPKVRSFSFLQISHFLTEMPSDSKCSSVCRANRIFRQYF